MSVGWGDVGFAGLGYDPLPGDREGIDGLVRDARVLADRLGGQADFLRRAAISDEWSGEAADAFKAQLKEIPNEMDGMASAFGGFATELRIYGDRLDEAKKVARRLDAEALDARARIRALSATAPAPAPAAAPAAGAPMAGPALARTVAGVLGATAPADPALAAAQADLQAVLDRAARLKDDFDEAQQDIAANIARLTQWAPKPPHQGWLDRLVSTAEKVTGADRIIHAVAHLDALIADCERFLDHVADLMEVTSTILGTASLIMFWAPGVSGALATASLATAAGAAEIKTGLYLVGAKDQYGRPLVSGKALGAAWLNVGVGLVSGGIAADAEHVGQAAKAAEGLTRAEQAAADAGRAAEEAKAAVGAAKTAEEAARATKAAEAAAEAQKAAQAGEAAARQTQKNVPSVLGKMSEDMNPESVLKTATKELNEVKTDGATEFMQTSGKAVVKEFKDMSQGQKVVTVAGRAFDLGNPIVVPVATGDKINLADWGGINSAYHSVRALPHEFAATICNEGKPLGFEFRGPVGEPQMATADDIPRPVMGR